VTPVGGDDEKQTPECQRYASDDSSGRAKFEPWNLCGGEPDPGEHHEQEPDFSEAYPRVMREGKDERHWHKLPT